ARQILAVAHFCHNSLQPVRFGRLEKSTSVVDDFADAIWGIHANGIDHPLPPLHERFVYQRTTVKVKAVEDIAVHRVGAGEFSYGRLPRRHQPADHLLDNGLSLRVKRNDLAVKHGTSSPESFFRR